MGVAYFTPCSMSHSRFPHRSPQQTTTSSQGPQNPSLVTLASVTFIFAFSTRLIDSSRIHMKTMIRRLDAVAGRSSFMQWKPSFAIFPCRSSRGSWVFKLLAISFDSLQTHRISLNSQHRQPTRLDKIPSWKKKSLISTEPCH